MRPVPIGFLVGRGRLSAVMFERVRAEHAALIHAAPGGRRPLAHACTLPWLALCRCAAAGSLPLRGGPTRMRVSPHASERAKYCHRVGLCCRCYISTGRPLAEAQRVGRVVVVQRAMTAIREDEVLSMFKTRKSYCGGRFRFAAFLKKKAILMCSRADAGKTEAW